MDSETIPIFLQLAAQIENDIVAGTYPEGAAVPSTNEYAAFYRINPATAGKGVNLLVERGILFKKRGIGMFVAPGAKQLLHSRRRAEFSEQYVTPLLREAGILGISATEVARMIEKEEPQ